jgi:mono/diheme cytochrome c family protein
MTSLISRSFARWRYQPRLRSLIPFAMAAATLAFTAPAFAADVEAGKYQAVLGDCRGCHGKDLSGGVTLMTPFGKLVTPNITPDKETGIGNYSGEAFRQAMKNGIAPGNKLLYPAMPYPSYARMPDNDIAALWDYLKTVKPVKKPVNVNQLRFPFNLRFMMRGWNILFFRPASYTDTAGKSAAWNRGAYLVNGPGHCSACHTPKNPFGADKGTALTGAALQGWYAPDLTGDRQAGLGAWSVKDIVEYLGTGRNAHSIASGPMAEAVENSTDQMTASDLNAIAVYLKDLPPSRGNGGGATGVDAQLRSGRSLYDINCAACHGPDCNGSLLFPALAGNANVRQVRADTVVRMVLAGSQAVATPKAPTGPGMPSLAWKLSDGQAADILTYVRNNWGNQAPAVSAETVGRIRGELHSGS